MILPYLRSCTLGQHRETSRISQAWVIVLPCICTVQVQHNLIGSVFRSTVPGCDYILLNITHSWGEGMTAVPLNYTSQS